MNSVATRHCTVIGIGNLLMGDEGVGVHAVRGLEDPAAALGATCLDGGTGGLHLLEAMQASERLVLIDATIDGAAPGTIRRLRPRYSSDYPRTLTAHDIGLKDLLDAMHLLGTPVDVTLFTVSIAKVQPMEMELSPPIRAAMPRLIDAVLTELRSP